MRELQTGLWHWQPPRPGWTAEQRWPRELSSYAIDDDERMLLFDPLAVPDALVALAGDSVTREQVLERLRPLPRLPVELVLPAHGAATDRTALERVLF